MREAAAGPDDGADGRVGREAAVDRTFEAVVVDWDRLAGGSGADAVALRGRIEALCAAGVHVVALSSDHPAGSQGRLFWCDRSSESTPAAMQWLQAAGITGGLILVAGDEALGSLPALARAVVVAVGHDPGRLGQLLDAQLDRRGDRRVPAIDDDPSWVIELPDQSGMQRAAEALSTLANGRVGIRGAREEDGPGTQPLFTVSGIYTREPVPKLLPGPVWINADIRCASDRRVLDLRSGVLLRTGRDDARLATMRFVSAARPEALALRAEGPVEMLAAGDAFAAPTGDTAMERARRGDVALARTADPKGGGITVAARDRCQTAGGRTVVERLAAWVADRGEVPAWDRAGDALARVDHIGFDGLLAEHRAAWARRWGDAAITIVGDADAELAARFATFHLLAAVDDGDELAIGARGLTGPAYGGHVFWDADVFVLPALAAVRPAAARAMLEYRLRRLPAARSIAASRGLAGARFPWESADDGNDATPRTVRGRNGELISIETGEHEEHIVADVAWAAAHYAAWSGDPAFLPGAGNELLLETARYWATRVSLEHDDRGHLRGVMGPDEYHEVVDDNAYTNVMARWNLRTAARLADQIGADAAEVAGWRHVADSLVDGWDPARGLYQQFDGYWSLEPLLAADAAPPPVAADVLLGADRVAGSQLIKQADVLMLYHLVPDEVVAGSLADNLAFYDARTAHGSSLSPAVHASLLARAGRPERALELFRLAARLDLDDVTGTTAGGLHLATMGGVWQALAFGFLGLHAGVEALDIDPCLPDAWQMLGMRIRFRGQPVEVRADHETVVVTCVDPFYVRVGGRPPQWCQPPSTSFPLDRSTDERSTG